MRHLAIALSMLFIASCNWSDLDAEFLAGVPDLSALKVKPPTQMAAQQSQALQSSGLGSQQSALQSTTAKNLENGADSLNSLIDTLAAGLDFIRQVTPSKRETDKCTWGPYPDNDHQGFDIQIVMTRDTSVFPAGYTYTLSWAVHGQSTFVDVVTGQFTGEDASSQSSAGSFTLDFATARAQLGAGFDTGDPTLNTLTLSYDHGTSANDDIRVWLKATYASAPDASYQHLRHKDGSGTMSYTADFPYPNSTTLPPLHVVAKAIWLADRSGHFTETVTWGIYPAVIDEECWDKDLNQTYLDDQFPDQINCMSSPCPAATGDPSTCVPFDNGS